MSKSPSKKQSVLNEDHFRTFGAIIHLFAKYEALMTGIMACVGKADRTFVSMLASELPYRGKRETTLAMIKSNSLPDEQQERIAWFLGELHKHNQLRNAIAHSLWKRGIRPATVRPLSMSVRGGKLDYRGLADDEIDYTGDELVDIANELISNYDKFAEYLDSVGLMPKRSSDDGT